MHEFDVAFKLTLQQVDLAIREIVGTAVARWLNVELPEVQNTRVDLLGETEAGDLVHLELQSSNDATMPLRMAEYYLRVFRQFGKFPLQVLLYIGEAPLRMAAELNGPTLKFAYRLIDMRDLDGARLLESDHIGDNIIAILARLPDPEAAIQRILMRIRSLPPAEKQAAFKRLVILAGLRKPLEQLINQETQRMPITMDIREHPLAQREYARGLQDGVHEGEVKVVRRQIQERFGSLPEWADQRLTCLTPGEIEDLSVRLLKVGSLEELFR